MFKSLKSKIALASATALTMSASAFAEVDATILQGMTDAQTAVTDISAAGLPVIIAIGVMGIGVGVVVGLLRRGSRVI